MSKTLKKPESYDLKHLKAMIILSEVLGLSYFNKLKVEHKTLRSAHRVFVVCLLLLGYVLMRPRFEKWTSRSITPLMLSLKINARFLSLFLVVIIQFLSNKRINEIFAKFLLFQLKANAENIFESIAHLPIKIFSFGAVVYLFQYFVCHFTFQSKTIIGTVFYSVILFLYLEFPSAQFVYLIFAVRGQFQAINVNLRKFVSRKMLKSTTVFTTNYVIEEISIHRQRYLELVEMTSEVTRAYSCQILVLITLSFAELIFFLQASFTTFILNAEPDEKDMWRFGGNAFDVLILFFKTLLIARCCETTVNEAIKTNFVISEIINSEDDMNIKYELRTFFIQKLCTDVNFSILGIFSLDYKLIYTVISTVTSYGIMIAIFYLTRGTKLENGSN